MPYIDHECEKCVGFGLVLPKENPLAEDAELDLCPVCHGAGRIPRKMATGGFNNLVAAMAVSEGWAYRTRHECMTFIEQAYT